MKLDEIKVCRLTHIENIPHILEFGITHKSSQNANPNFISIGDKSLIDLRDSYRVRVDNGNFQSSHAQQITLGEFIPFYFGIKMPMLYVVQNGGNFVQRGTPPQEIVYLVCYLTKLIKTGHSFYFSDGHATDSMTSFYDQEKLKELPEVLDWQAIKANYWGGLENLNTKRKKQAEFLINGDLSPELIEGYICYDEWAGRKIADLGISQNCIKVLPKAYY
jgi:hypothetical protein